MKTSMGYRMFRNYYNSNSQNFELFGSRIYNPQNDLSETTEKNERMAAYLRVILAILLVGTVTLAAIYS